MPNRFVFNPLRDQAVIDIGSNSVRLVIYRVEGRANAPVLNEKVLAGLGRGMPETGRLNADGVRRALEALRRFRLLVDAIGVQTIHAVATAAVRDASDGPDFINQIRSEAGFDVRIISGAEEGRLSALGVLAGAPGAGGVAGDLGGSSLELVTLSPEGPGKAESWQLGPLAMGVGDVFDTRDVRQRIDNILTRSDVLAAGKGTELHAVGGAWRAIAKIDMITRHYPLQVLHNYAMSRAEALTICDFVAGQSKRSLERIDGSIGKRADTLPYAATLMRALLDHGQFDSVVISSHGLREGILFEALSPEERAQDPLVAGAIAMLGSDPRMREFGEALFWWVMPVFEDLPRLFPARRGEVLRAAACMLADIGATLHPDDRARIAFEIVLRAPYPAASHIERVFLARVCARRYGAKLDEIEPNLVKRLLDEERLVRADALGAAIRLGADLSGRSAKILTQTRLNHRDGKLTLSTNPAMKGLFAEQALKRLDQLGQILKTPVATLVE
ncbi:guanosine-5'-triphosphate,3'-diphosphate pyrophosphatase [Candidatus Phycosocius bacilliformis]|uniref:Guanosine-5'-triphosphate,3'-diphosphate pyrophosphatase n=1 Tax=Candidatus Phycosocius bacilliformis TaxID=1445552 RepID=A0A2P2E7V3_9PROT|nr:Ppx/GppA family phosphatase [Candidatus Phycosocius bacilliformis]GBF57117.1 guanosine-5'-triphosphate,3'-diphosphate pyrophosphatase [Candidatus Phycosocius bacilliformis]